MTARPLRVAILDRNMGVNPYALGLASGLRENGHEVLIGSAAGADVEGALAVYPRAGVGGRRAEKLAEAVAGLARAVRALRAYRPDVVHYQWTEPLDLLAQQLVTRIVPDAVSVVTVHRVGGHVQRAMLARASGAVAFASSVAGRLDGVELIAHGNYASLVEPIAKDEARRRLGVSPTGAVLAFVGQIRPDKGVDALLRSAAGLDAEVVVAGTVIDSDYRLRLAELESSLGLHVRWIESQDALPMETLVAAACAADAVVLPFVDAVQSGSVIFAMTLGACVVTTDVGETAATVGANGVVVPAGDGAALRAGIRDLLARPGRADGLGRQAREAMLAERSWDLIAREVEQVYTRALAARRRPTVGSGASVVLCFHAVEDSASELAVSAEALRGHVERLAARGYRFVTASELVAAPGDGAKRAAVTFDDGYRSVRDAALPVLAELGIPATVFPIAGRVGTTAELPGAGERELLSWDEVRELAEHGWEIGSHTWSHPDLTTVSEAELACELIRSRELVAAEIGTRCTALAYPYGAADGRVAEAARRAGYEAAFTVPRRWRSASALHWPRITVWRSDAPRTVAFKASATVRAVRSSRIGSSVLATAGAHRRGGAA